MSDPLLTKAEHMSSTGGASVITSLRKGKTAADVREKIENVLEAALQPPR